MSLYYISTAFLTSSTFTLFGLSITPPTVPTLKARPAKKNLSRSEGSGIGPEGLWMVRRASGWPGGPLNGPQGLCQIYSISHKHCSVILLKAPNQAEGLVRRFRGSQSIPGVMLQNLLIISNIFKPFW